MIVPFSSGFFCCAQPTLGDLGDLGDRGDATCLPGAEGRFPHDMCVDGCFVAMVAGRGDGGSYGSHD